MIPKDLFIWDNTKSNDINTARYLFQYKGNVIYSWDNDCLGMNCETDPFHKEHGKYCKPITKLQYITFKLLGYLDNYEEKRIPRKNVKVKNKRSKSASKTLKNNRIKKDL